MADWTQITLDGLQNFWEGFIAFMPKLIIALILFLVGWFIAVAIGKIISEILKRLKLDKLFEARGWQDAMNKAEFKMTISEFIGSLCKWILILVVLAIAVQNLGASAFSEFLLRVVNWLPNLLVAILIFVATVVIASFAEKAVRASLGRARLGYAGLGGSIVKWAVWVFGIATILVQLGIGTELIPIFFQGVVAFFAIAGGLAFGLGGKDAARELLGSFREKIRK